MAIYLIIYGADSEMATFEADSPAAWLALFVVSILSGIGAHALAEAL